MSTAGDWCTVNWARGECGTATVVVSGEVDAATAPLLERAFEEAGRVASDVIVVDVAEVTFMDAAGLRVLLVAQAAAARRHARLRFDRLSASVRRLFEVAGVEDRFRDAIPD
jgi:anti-sigma B factor antagonist